MLARDFNARTGKENDFITDESGTFIPGEEIPPPPNLTKRQNFDNIVNDHGKQLLDLCKTCDLGRAQTTRAVSVWQELPCI